MTAAQFIDIVLTPMAGGIGGFIGMGYVANQDPEKYGVLAKPVFRALLAVAIAVTLFFYKIF